MAEVQTVTIACKMKVNSQLAKEIDETLKVFAAACDWINAQTPEDMTNRTRMQSFIYRDVRNRFGLSSNLAIQAIRRVCANRKTAQQKQKKVRDFSPTSATYDARIFSFREGDWSVSLKLLHQRHRFELLTGNYQRERLKGLNPTSATLVKRKKGDYYIHINIDLPTREPREYEGVIGVDLGGEGVANTSEGESWSSESVTEQRNHYAKMKAILRKKTAKGTRTTRRRCRQLLARLSRREKRYHSWLNHCISRRLVNNAVTNKKVIALEDLTAIRRRRSKKPKNKRAKSDKYKRIDNTWAFYQLRQFLIYKCLLAGVKLIFVKPAYVSQTCHVCHYLGEINGDRFSCQNCGNQCDVDYNGSINIAALGSLINRPRGTGLFCDLKDEPQNVHPVERNSLGLPKT